MTAFLRLVAFLLLALCLAGCARGFPAAEFAGANHFSEQVLRGETFDLQWFARGQGSLLRVYIEGDGRAWLTRSRPSSDPTPDEAVAFRLAAADSAPAVAYLPRPCQFAGEGSRNCLIPFWTSARFSEPVIRDLSLLLDAARALAGADRLELVGYSGGGAVAVLLAARRSDVARLITVAGNLDHAAWTALHHVSPLRDSLNPKDVAPQVQHIPQVHLVGANDAIMPRAVAESFVRAMTDPSQTSIVAVAGADHESGWAAALAAVLSQPGWGE